MALTSAEVARLKYELGYNVLAVGAEPYVGVAVLFEQVIAPYTTAGASTTSSTAVTAASAPTPATLTLASAVGFTAGDRVIVDVDSRQESATIQAVAGSTITLLLSKAHTGTYPVSVEGGESIIRGILQKLQALDGLSSGGDAGVLGSLGPTIGIKRVDEVEFFGGGQGAGSGNSRLGEVRKLREMWRDELASVLGIVRLNGRSGAGSISVY